MPPTQYKNIIELIDAIDPIKYSKTRNYLHGAVTKLSPYISRGVISTKQVYNAVKAKGYKLYEIEKFVQELAWRDYFQYIWTQQLDAINTDLKNTQTPILHKNISSNIIQATTKITAIDDGIEVLYNTGYMHNHLRMYVASIACNVGFNHWLIPAKWMYYHLLDADWASNALSWQWVAGSFSNKKYVANQENINKYCSTSDSNTFLDISYDSFENITCPKELIDNEAFVPKTVLPKTKPPHLNNSQPLYIYNFYNLDPQWCINTNANKLLLLEPSFFNLYPSSEKVINFILDLSKNIDGLQVFVGEFHEIATYYNGTEIHFKEHPTNKHYKGMLTNRDWLAPQLQGNLNSFFSYWKKVAQVLKK